MNESVVATGYCSRPDSTLVKQNYALGARYSVSGGSGRVYWINPDGSRRHCFRGQKEKQRLEGKSVIWRRCVWPRSSQVRVDFAVCDIWRQQTHATQTG